MEKITDFHASPVYFSLQLTDDRVREGSPPTPTDELIGYAPKK
jgi:hypothetical protein